MNPKTRYLFGAILLLAIGSCAFVAFNETAESASAKTRPQAAKTPAAAPKAVSVTPSAAVNVDAGIELAAAYIISNTNADGRVAYERHLNPLVTPNVKRYNILRHAGTIYSTYLYEQANPQNAEMHATRLRLANYVVKYYLREIENGMMTIVSSPEEEKVPEPQAKLGAAGLALLGMANLMKTGEIKPEIIRGLGEFILYLQKPDGSFYSKFIYSKNDHDDEFASSYYPGEAALGLLYLYDVDPQEKWLVGSKKALLNLADSRKGMEIVPEFDHWAMLATRKLFETPSNGVTPEEHARLVFHARQMAQMILPTQLHRPGTLEDGSMGLNISPCSNGTKMEGLVAIYHILEEDPAYQKTILAAVDRLCAFLLRAQVQEPYLRGGLPSSADWRLPGGPKKKYVVRIDNVQHVMSAWINYRKIKR